jgi:hypothetical protein
MQSVIHTDPVRCAFEQAKNARSVKMTLLTGLRREDAAEGPLGIRLEE